MEDIKTVYEEANGYYVIKDYPNAKIKFKQCLELKYHLEMTLHKFIKVLVMLNDPEIGVNFLKNINKNIFIYTIFLTVNTFVCI